MKKYGKFIQGVLVAKSQIYLQSASIFITIVNRWPDLNVEKGQISQEKILDSDSW